jgi:hypothetical protein
VDAVRAWLKTTVGSVVGIFVALLLVAGIIWAYTKRDQWFANRFNQKTVSSVAHGDTAKTELAVADTAHVQGVVIRDNWRILASSPAVRSNPVATHVASEATKVIANADTETTHLRAANNQLQLQVRDLESRGPVPRPRAVPYLDPLYSFSSKGRAVPVLRAGVDYRIVSWVHAKVEASYEPPPAGAPDQRPEFRVTVGGHITLR